MKTTIKRTIVIEMTEDEASVVAAAIYNINSKASVMLSNKVQKIDDITAISDSLSVLKPLLDALRPI